MRAAYASTVLSKLREELGSACSLHACLEVCCRHVGELLDCDTVTARALGCSADWVSSRSPHILSGHTLNLNAGEACFEDDPQALPIAVNDLLRSRLDPRIVAALRVKGILSVAIVPICENEAVGGFIECRFHTRYHRWRKEELLLVEQMGDYARLFGARHIGAPGGSTSSQAIARAELDEARLEYQRLAEYGNLLIIKTNADFSVTEVIGDTQRMLGVTPKELLDDPSIWRRFLPGTDLKSLGRAVGSQRQKSSEISEEIRVVNRATGQVRWLLVRAVPLFSEQGEFVGCEGFGLDITERRSVQEELVQQSRRVEALYEVSSSLQVHVDPAVVALRGLGALIRATGSDGGLSCFCDRESDGFEIVAAEGLSAEYIEGVTGVLRTDHSLIRKAVETRKGFLIENLQADPRAAVDLAKKEGLRSAIVMPLIFEDHVLGALAVFRKGEGSYVDADYDLVAAAASQISIAARQAEMYAAEKRQAGALAALYRLSHELSKHFTPKEVGEHAFRIIQDEVPCRRMWLGVINEQGSHIVGQAGVGPGLSNQIIGVQIELDLRHDFLDEALSNKHPVILPPGEKVECSGLNRIINILSPGCLIIMPLVSLGQVVGLMVLEPTVSSVSFAESKLALLNSMGGEIAIVLLARRFEARMADADKMRMAGVLASGVAHNFNNLLQAVMGQASLIEMQLPAGSPLLSSARMIVEAANRGASLIGHLLSFSMKDNRVKKVIATGSLLADGADFYRSVLGASIRLAVEIEPELPEIFGDRSQIQQAITNLLVNAKEAIACKQQGDGLVSLRAKKVRLNTNEIDPNLAPGVYVRIEIVDSGVGMDDSQLTRCFEPFYTTKNTDIASGLGVSGSGLGLSSAFSIVRQHAGYITVESQQGVGSAFSIYLPAASGKHKAIGEGAGIDESFEVLTLALDETVGISVKSFMQSCGLKTFIAGKRFEAVQALKRSRASTRLFIMDVDRWGDESLTFVQSLRQEHSDVVILVLTSSKQRWSELLGACEGIEVIEKPLSVWVLHTLIGRLYRGDPSQPLTRTLEVSREASLAKPEASKSDAPSGGAPQGGRHEQSL